MHALFNSAIILSIADLEYRPQTVWEKNHMHKVVVTLFVVEIQHIGINPTAHI